jgi:hypothetical protein
MVPVVISRNFGLFVFLFLEIGGNTEVGYSSHHPKVKGSSPAYVTAINFIYLPKICEGLNTYLPFIKLVKSEYR